MNPYDSVDFWNDEKDFLNWLRSQTRRIWTRHPVKTTYKARRRFKAPIGRKGKEVFACTCELCGKTVKSSESQVDHKQEGGSFSNWEEYTVWAKRILWVSIDDIRELCKPCHGAVTLSQRLHITLDEALIQKQAIELIKNKHAKAWLESRGIFAKRKKDYRELIIQQLNKEKI